MKPSGACYALIKQSEGLRLDAYRDAGGVTTVGYGHTGSNIQSKITYEQAEQYLDADVNVAADAVSDLAGGCTQGQFDALTDFVFNLGSAKLQGSTLLRYHKAGNFTLAANEFSRWTRCEGKVLPGLVKRRAAEAHLYLDGTLPPAVPS